MSRRTEMMEPGSSGALPRPVKIPPGTRGCESPALSEDTVRCITSRSLELCEKDANSREPEPLEKRVVRDTSPVRVGGVVADT